MSKADTNQYPGISTSKLNFILLIAALKFSGYRFCLFNELPYAGWRKTIVLNFDDAYCSVYKTAFPVLSFFGIKAHVCITGESLYNPERENKLALMNIEQALALQQKGWDFINHTFNHAILLNKNEQQLREEITTAAESFQKKGLLLNPYYFCLPEGRSDAQTEQFINCSGYKYILTTNEDIWEVSKYPVRVPRINISSQKFWYAFYKINFKFANKRKRLVPKVI